MVALSDHLSLLPSQVPVWEVKAVRVRAEMCQIIRFMAIETARDVKTRSAPSKIVVCLCTEFETTEFVINI